MTNACVNKLMDPVLDQTSFMQTEISVHNECHFNSKTAGASHKEQRTGTFLSSRY